LNKVPDNELTKLYYAIGEVADMFGVNTSLIRFWEKEFDIITPKKNKKGNRLFTPKDIQNFNKIYHLVKVQGFTLDGARKTLKNNTVVQSEPVSVESDVVEKLEEIKRRLLKMKQQG